MELRFIVGLCLLGLSAAVDWDVITDLDQYVHSDDGHFEWHEIASYRYDNVTLYILNMTSQLYQTEAFSTRSLWWHIMAIGVPDNIEHMDFGILGITGGSNNIRDPPGRADPMGLLVADIARDTGIISGYVSQVPNQPVQFYNDPSFQSRSEDQIIAWSWRTFLDSPEPSDPTVILRMPMTKAAKRGLDTIAEFAKIRVPGSDITKFGVTGISKRGWTAWSIAATDKRVVATIPMVFSMINMGETLKQHNRDMDGGWSFALSPYWNENLTQELFNPKVQRVFDVEDIYHYKERLTIPFLAISSSGDEFFLPDDNHLWWNDFPEPKWLMMLPNTDHVMAGHYDQIYWNSISFVYSVANNIPIPKVSWSFGQTSTGGSYIRYTAQPPPVSVNAYWAHTLAADSRRDYRLISKEPGDLFPNAHPVVWRHNITVVNEGNGEYYAEIENFEGEWTGLFIEGEWVGPTGLRMAFTSQVNIAPNSYPRPPCTDADSCYGFLT